MTWTDETEANYRKWHKERYGVEPPKVNLPMKEESMKKDKIPEGFHEHAIGIHEDHEESSGGVAEMLKLTEPMRTRTRRPKGLPPGVTVETYQEATVHVEIPARPTGMKKVTMAIHSYHNTAAILIDWPEGKTGIEALSAHFVVEATRGE